jgi:endoglucanase
MLTACSTASFANTLPRLETRGTRFVEAEAAKAVELRGVNLGNWLLIEPGVFPDNPNRIRDGYTLRRILTERFGAADAQRLMELWYDHFITDADFDRVKAFGFNFVRIGFDYEVVEAEPGVLRNEWYRHFDRAIDACEKRGIYVLIDMHGAPLRQIDGRQSGQIGVNRFFFEPAAQDRAMVIWRAIAERYKGRHAVFAYEALNEPWGGGAERLRDFVYRWYREMRQVDPHKILCFPGGKDSLDGVYSSPREQGQTNVMYDMHFYPGFFGWGKPTPQVHEQFFTQTLPPFIRLMEQWQSPLMIGEFNVVYDKAGGPQMMRRYFDLATKHGFAMCAWTLKEYTAEGGIGNRAWGLTTNAKPLKSPNWRDDSLETIEAWIRNISQLEIDPNPRLIEALRTEQKE